MAGSALNRLGIIIVTYQSERHIGPLLRSLAATIDRERPPIWVYDNASTDSTLEAFERENRSLNLPVHLIKGGTNLGFARANNEVYRLMREQMPCEITILLNPDTEVQEGWWQPLLQALEDPAVGTAVPLLLMPDGTINARGDALHFVGLGFVQGFGETLFEAGSSDAGLFFASGAALAFRTATLEEMNAKLGLTGIFWEDLFLYAEDTDLGWRMRLVGLDNRLVMNSHVTHDYRFWTQKDDSSSERFFWVERNRYLLLFANFKWPTLILLIPWIASSEIALSLGLWKLYPHRLKLWRAVLEQLRLPVFWSRRQLLQEGRTATDHSVLRHMTGSIRHGARAFGPIDRMLDALLRLSHRILCAVIWW